MLVWYDQLVYVPVLIAPVRQEASDGDRDLASPQLLQSNLRIAGWATLEGAGDTRGAGGSRRSRLLLWLCLLWPRLLWLYASGDRGEALSGVCREWAGWRGVVKLGAGYARRAWELQGANPHHPNPKPDPNPAGQSRHRARPPRATRSTCHAHAMHMHAHMPCTRLQRVGDRLTRCVKALLATPRSTPGALAHPASPRQPTPAQPTPAHPNQPHPTPRRPPICPRHATLIRMSHACSGSVSPSS